MSNNASTRKMTFFIAFHPLERITAVSAAPARALLGVFSQAPPIGLQQKRVTVARILLFRPSRHQEWLLLRLLPRKVPRPCHETGCSPRRGQGAVSSSRLWT